MRSVHLPSLFHLIQVLTLSSSAISAISSDPFRTLGPSDRQRSTRTNSESVEKLTRQRIRAFPRSFLMSQNAGVQSAIVEICISSKTTEERRRATEDEKRSKPNLVTPISGRCTSLASLPDTRGLRACDLMALLFIIWSQSSVRRRKMLH